MNCDNQEFMFSRDFVRCIMTKLSPRWREPLDFRYGTQQGSPFTSEFEEAVEYVVMNEFDSLIRRAQTMIKNSPMTMATFRKILEISRLSTFGYLVGNVYVQLKFFMFVSVSAHFFYENGCAGNYDITAADMICAAIFELRKDGYFVKNTWKSYEKGIVDIKLLLQGHPSAMDRREYSLFQAL